MWDLDCWPGWARGVIPGWTETSASGEDGLAFFHEGGLTFLVVRAHVAVVDHLLAQSKIALFRIF